MSFLDSEPQLSKFNEFAKNQTKFQYSLREAASSNLIVIFAPINNAFTGTNAPTVQWASKIVPLYQAAALYHIGVVPKAESHLESFHYAVKSLIQSELMRDKSLKRRVEALMPKTDNGAGNTEASRTGQDSTVQKQVQPPAAALPKVASLVDFKNASTLQAIQTLLREFEQARQPIETKLTSMKYDAATNSKWLELKAKALTLAKLVSETTLLQSQSAGAPIKIKTLFANMPVLFDPQGKTVNNANFLQTVALKDGLVVIVDEGISPHNEG